MFILSSRINSSKINRNILNVYVYICMICMMCIDMYDNMIVNIKYMINKFSLIHVTDYSTYKYCDCDH